MQQHQSSLEALVSNTQHNEQKTSKNCKMFVLKVKKDEKICFTTSSTGRLPYTSTEALAEASLLNIVGTDTSSIASYAIFFYIYSSACAKTSGSFSTAVNENAFVKLCLAPFDRSQTDFNFQSNNNPKQQ